MKTEMMKLLVACARDASMETVGQTAERGDLVVEVTRMSIDIDIDSIGWLVGEGQAAYREDGLGPTRHVWDILPLNPGARLNALGVQRWENASFRAIPKRMVERAGLKAPEVLEPLCG